MTILLFIFIRALAGLHTFAALSMTPILRLNMIKVKCDSKCGAWETLFHEKPLVYQKGAQLNHVYQEYWTQ